MHCGLKDPRPSTGNEVERFFRGELRNPLQVLLAVDGAATPVGFVELSVRSYAEECVTESVAYLEGWYVAPEARRRGMGTALVRAAEDWAREQGCAELASDALLDNHTGAATHPALASRRR